MNRAELEENKRRLLQLRNSILNGGILNSSEDLQVSPDDLLDETDLATSVINQQVTFNIRNRELEKLRQIEAALQRIDEGMYGICDDCDEEIGSKRLKYQPWTNLCIIHAEERERENSKYVRQA
jgi:DnaK suppressor protein